MKKLIFLLSFVSLLSCSSSDDTENTVIPLEISNLQIRISNISTESVNITLEYSASGTTTDLTEKVFLKKNEEQDFIEISPGNISNLERGARYRVFARVTNNEVSFDSTERTFITKGFQNSNDLSGFVKEVNQIYTVFNNFSNSDFDAAAELSAYIKVGTDSIAVEKITIIDNQNLELEIVDNTLLQQFFNMNASSYESAKEFTVGLFSGEYYQEIIESSQKTYEDVTYKGFSFFNLVPNFEEFVIPATGCANTNNEDNFIVFKGDFWGRVLNGNDTEINIPDEVIIQITNTNDSTIQSEYTLANIYEVSGPTLGVTCVQDRFQFLRELIGNAIPGFHWANQIYLRYDNNILIPGNYEISIEVAKGLNRYKSDKFSFTL
ncbi:hypothetical protein [Aquimarina rubra]|uniref:DUF4249 family protein n=1 Tax=Aquimarina rubra TaxID=1920033 RepID=A0ABW5LJG7_9FLAO